MPRLRILLIAALALTLVVGTVTLSTAAEPASSELTVPAESGQTVTSNYTGTVQPDVNPTGTCNLGSPSEDTHRFTLIAPAERVGAFPQGVTYAVTFTIEWQPVADNDLILSVLTADGQVVASSDGGSPKEAITQLELPAGEYDVIACGFANGTPQDYAGSIAVSVEDFRAPPAADAQGLAFSASVPADVQRDEGEPIIEIDPKGVTYTCGPTGFSQAEDYLQVSTDGGDQFHLLGEPPRGQQSAGGGGDCALATGTQENDEGFHTLSYVGLSGLANFAVATSPDEGRTFVSSPLSESIPGVDRQWTTFSDADTVWLNYNQVAPRAVTVQRSDDGGLTYSEPEVVSPNPGFPGPFRSLPPELNPAGNDLPAIYYPWTQGTAVRLAVSLDDGATFTNCTVAEAEGNPGAQFPVADHDDAGNIYVAYTDQASFNTFLVHAPASALTDCLGGTGGSDDAVKANPGFSEPVQVNRDEIITSVFPWLVAGGEPGRVGVSFYGTETAGRPDTLDPKSWHVYVNQSLNALDGDATFSQAQVTTHPNHFDQICLLGLGCSTGGDRSLVDFFALDYNPVTGEYIVVYNRAHKRPDDVGGLVSTPIVARQIGGPSNGGGTIEPAGREPLRSSSTDPTEDAIADYSSLGDAGARTYVPAMDVTSVEVSEATELEAGTALDGGGYTVTMQLEDLSDGALQQAATDAQGQSLLWIFRYVDGYRYAGASARWNPLEGFTFGYNGYVGSAQVCGSSPQQQGEGDQCLYYPGGTPIQGAVDQEAGTITMTVPLELLEALEGGTGPGERPEQVPAEPGDRIYDASVFTMSNAQSARQEAQGFLYPLDNTPAMDFEIPGGEDPQVPPGPRPTPSPSPTPPGNGDGGTGGATTVTRFGGANRLSTAALVAGEGRDEADTVVLARADVYADALAGGPLAVDRDAPLLLSASDRLSPETAAEIDRLGAGAAILLGGTAALSPQVQSDLEAMDVETTRVSGPNRFATAAAIKDALPPSDEVFIAEGGSADPARGFPDALSAAGIASVQTKPVLLVVQDSLPSETARELSPEVDATIVGGTAAVDETVEAQIDALSATTSRLSGATRYGTSAAVAGEALARGITPDITWVATGTNFPDGLVAGAAAGFDDGVLVLVDGNGIDGSPETRDFLEAQADAIREVKLAGGTAAISSAVEQRIRQLVGASG